MTHGLYNPILIAISVLIAIFAGYTALDLANSVVAARGKARVAWLAGGSLAMGTGIWSMHFVGMLAFRLPGVPVSYTVPLLILSVVVAIFGSAIALLVVSRARPMVPTLIAAGLIMGGAICGMHYIGIASMHLAALIEWDARRVAASIVIAALASYVALWLAFRFRREMGRRAVLHRLAGGVLMGLAISGMHYTAMSAMSFLPTGTHVPLLHDNVLATDQLALAVTLTTLLILGIALAGAIVERALTRRSVMAEEAERRATEEAALHEMARTLAAAGSIRDVVQSVVVNGLEKAHARGAYIERAEEEAEPNEVEVMAAAGRYVPAPGTLLPYTKSLTEEAVARGELQWPTRLETLPDSVAPYLTSISRRCTGLIVPLATETSVLGVLVLVRGPDQPAYQSSDLAFAGALGDMTSAALGRVLLLQQLTESEQRFRELAENIREIFWILDPRTRTTLYVSPAYEEVMGCPVGTLSRQTEAFLELVHPEDRGLVEVALDALTRHEHEVEYRIVRPDGGLRWINARGFPIRDEQGEISRIVGIAEDVTTRKAAEGRQRFLAEASRVLATSLDYKETLGNVARIAVPELADWCAIMLREDGKAVRTSEVTHVDANKTKLAWKFHERFPSDPGASVRAYQILGTGMPELVAEVTDSWLEQMAESPEQLDLMRALAPRSLMLVPLIARGRTLGLIWLAHAESGRLYNADDVAVAEELARRAAAAIDNALLHRDSKDARREAEGRAQQETALREATAAVSSAFTTEEVIQRIAERAIEAANADSALVERIDSARGEIEVAAMAGQPLMTLGRRLPYTDSFAELAVASGQPTNIERLSEAGHHLPDDLAAACADCSAAVLPLFSAGEPIGVLVLIRAPRKGKFRQDEIARVLTFGDLAALAFRKAYLMEESERRRMELERVTESRARLMRGFSHDVREPLGAANGYLDLLDEGIVEPLSDKWRGMMQNVRRSIGRAVSLTEDLLELARAEAGQIEIDPGPMHLTKAALEVVEEYRAKAEARDMVIKTDLPAEFPAIESDTSRVRQILGNLISNAIKYAANGSLTVRVDAGEGDGAPGPGRWAAVHVTDTGPGITPEQLKLLFQEFKRLEPAGEGGAGIGLAISRTLARVLGGDITVVSRVGKGSTFTLWLPVNKPHTPNGRPLKS
ncbi:MAG: MHYT domain-containing protein [Longimicrobiales bacterium]